MSPPLVCLFVVFLSLSCVVRSLYCSTHLVSIVVLVCLYLIYRFLYRHPVLVFVLSCFCLARQLPLVGARALADVALPEHLAHNGDTKGHSLICAEYAPPTVRYACAPLRCNGWLWQSFLMPTKLCVKFYAYGHFSY